MAAADPDCRRIVLLGKTGSGKSSLANIIFGGKVMFEVFHTSTSGTKLCQSLTRTIYGRTVQLIDTPGVFDTNPNNPDLNPKILQCMIECAPGPHAFLLVLKVERFTKHEQLVADVFSKNFCEEALKYTTVVFTHGNQLQPGEKIEEWLNDNEALNNLVQKCKGRCHVFDSRYWENSNEESYRNNQNQVRELLQTIDKTVMENGGSCYTNRTLQDVDDSIQQEKACIRTEPGDMSEEEVDRKAKENTFSTFMPLVGGAGALLALLGMVVLKR